MVKNKILVVTGMHRSGTSLVTQWLHKCGLHAGDALPGPGAGNEDGYYEDPDFLYAHQGILKGHRLPVNGYADPIKQLSHNETDILKDIIHYKNGFYQQWGWKDPRTCLFLDTYRQLIPGAFYFVVFRDYESVVSSLIGHMHQQTEKENASRKGLSKFIWENFKKKNSISKLCKKHCQHYLKLWISYNEAILQHLQQLPAGNYLVADYAALYNNDRPVFERITGEWGFTLRFVHLKSIYKNHLLHNSFTIDAYVKDKTLLGKAASVEASMRRMTMMSTKIQAMNSI